MSFADTLAAQRRLALLELLSRSGEYTSNEHLLGATLDGLGHRVSADRLRADLAWLAEQELLRSDEVGGVQVATLTERGHDVARGRAECPGVARPRAPRAPR